MYNTQAYTVTIGLLVLLATINLECNCKKPSIHQKKRNSNGTELLVHEREFSSPAVRVQIDCSRDKTTIKANFTRPFRGILSAGPVDSTSCKLRGEGDQYYELAVLHNETRCDTQWDADQNSIINTLYIRFHSTLETGADLAKNVACRLQIGDLLVGRKPSSRTGR